MASKYAAAHTSKIKGIVFWASYPNSNISHSRLRVLSIHGSRDGLISNDKYTDSKNNFPQGAIFKVINGGTHCNFGSYGFQKGDNHSTIHQSEQQGKIVNYTVEFLNSFN